MEFIAGKRTFLLSFAELQSIDLKNLVYYFSYQHKQQSPDQIKEIEISARRYIPIQTLVLPSIEKSSQNCFANVLVKQNTVYLCVDKHIIPVENIEPLGEDELLQYQLKYGLIFGQYTTGISVMSNKNFEKFVLISDQDYTKQVVYNVGALKSIYLRE